MALEVEMDQVLKDGLPDTVTYTADGEADVDISAIWMPDSEPEEYTDDGKWRIRRGNLLCDADDVPSPSNRDAVTIGSETWQVDDEIGIHQSNGAVTLPLVHKGRIEVSGPEHRLRR